MRAVTNTHRELPPVHMGRFVDEFFDYLSELYLEFHRGTYTSHGGGKARSRRGRGTRRSCCATSSCTARKTVETLLSVAALLATPSTSEIEQLLSRVPRAHTLHERARILSSLASSKPTTQHTYPRSKSIFNIQYSIFNIYRDTPAVRPLHPHPHPHPHPSRAPQRPPRAARTNGIRPRPVPHPAPHPRPAGSPVPAGRGAGGGYAAARTSDALDRT
ncbi:hypothetical protein B0H15DRAFT_871001, partial [Mycena belliarum]